MVEYSPMNIKVTPFSSLSFEPITRILNKKFWFGGDVYYPWVHPANKVSNALMIHLDGCPQYKFQACANGKLRLIQDYTKGKGSLYLYMKPLQTITLAVLIHKLESINDDKSPQRMQAICKGNNIEIFK